MMRLMATMAIASAGLAAADALTLKEQAFVRGPELRLGDIAEIEGVRAAALADVSLGSAPRPGESKRLPAAIVAARLRTAGFAPEEFELKGAIQVEATTLAQEVSRFDLVASLREHILAAMPWNPEDTKVDIPAPREDLIVPDGAVDFAWSSAPDYRFVGDGAFEGAVTVDGRTEQTLLVRATVEPFVEVPVPATDLPRGRPIGAADLVRQRMPMSRVAQGTAIDAAEILGLLPQRTLLAGQPINARHLVRPTLIRRNQPVVFETASGAVRVQGRAIAVTEARAGDIVVLRGMDTKETFQGVVREDGAVLVP